MLLGKDQLPKVPFEGMNEVHLRELEILNQLYTALEKGASLEEIENLFIRFLEDVKNHFSYEEKLMEKTKFFAYQVHKGEHQRVLKELEELYRLWKERKDSEKLKDYLKDTFVSWLLEHVKTMDTATASYIVSSLGFIPFKK